MALYNFQRRFVPMILGGEKRHTIRAKRARATKPGEMLHLYTGLRQKGAKLLMRVRCTRVQDIEIEPGLVPAYTRVWIDGAQLSPDEFEQLARCDGFASRWEMLDFWEGRLPFAGDIIHWSFEGKISGTTMEEEYRRQCQRMGCQNTIDPKHKQQKFCSDACRQKDGREMRKAAQRNKPPVLCAKCRAELRRKGNSTSEDRNG